MKENINAQRVMTTTQQILTTFTSKVDLEKEYTGSELKKMLTEVIKEIHEGEKGEKKARKKAKREEGEEKKKREPTAYNLFVKETMSVVKEENPKMSQQDLMKEVGRMWKEKKGKEKEEDEEEVKDEVVEEKEEDEEEVKEEEVVEKKEEDEEEVKEEEVVEKKEKKKGKKGKKE